MNVDKRVRARDVDAERIRLLAAGNTNIHAIAAGRRHHRKSHTAWDAAVRASGGVYSSNLDAIARRFPQLTPMELRVSAMVKAMLPSWKIAQALCITEKAVENYRVKIRRKTACADTRLNTLLARI